MVIDIFEASACCIASIATLKQKYPESICIADKNSNQKKLSVTYDFDDEKTYCLCGNWCAYASHHPSDFSIKLEGLNRDLFAQNSELFKIVLEKAGKMMKGLNGAEIQLMKKVK